MTRDRVGGRAYSSPSHTTGRAVPHPAVHVGGLTTTENRRLDAHEFGDRITLARVAASRASRCRSRSSAQAAANDFSGRVRSLRLVNLTIGGEVGTRRRGQLFVERGERCRQLLRHVQIGRVVGRQPIALCDGHDRLGLDRMALDR
jgi:hypothetical protein